MQAHFSDLILSFGKSWRLEEVALFSWTLKDLRILFFMQSFSYRVALEKFKFTKERRSDKNKLSSLNIWILFSAKAHFYETTFSHLK